MCVYACSVKTPPNYKLLYHMVWHSLHSGICLHSCGMHYLKLLLCLLDTRWGLATGGVQRVQLSGSKGRQLTTLSCTEQTTTVPLSYSDTSTSWTMNRRESHSHLLILEWDLVFLPHHRSNGSTQCVKLQSVH